MAAEIVDMHEERRNRSLKNQQAAADPYKSAWVSANAGTGKTKVLTDRVIRLLLAGADPSRILCLTYTKAAASEMANRLFDSLGEWTVLPDEALKARIEALVGETVPWETLKPARRLFARALETPGGLKIQTIHAFAQAVLKRFPLEANVSPHFDVLDERTSAELVRDARQNLFERIVRLPNSDLAAAVDDLVAMLSETTLDLVLTNVIEERQRFRQIMQIHGGVDEYSKKLSEELGLARGETDEEILAAALQSIALKEQDLKAAIQALLEGSPQDQSRGSALAAFLSAEAREDVYQEYVGIFLTGTGDPRKNLVTNKTEKDYPGTRQVLTDEQDRVVETENKRRAARAVAATHSLFVFAEALLEEVERLKSMRARLDYDDLISRMRNLVSAQGAAWVHYKLDGGIDHILVDEAQDTSPEQWDIVRGLSQEFFSGFGVFQEKESTLKRTMFAVGDEKQSIYSFQGAEPRRFGEERAYYQEQTSGAGYEFAPLDLILSFRSTREILKAVDAVFEPAQALQGLTSTGEPIEHEAYRIGVKGLVELWPTVVIDKPEDRDAWDEPLDRPSASSPRAVLAKRIADQIATWVESGEPVTEDGKPITAGDIMILVRKRDAFVDEMIRALKRRDIPVAGRDRMVLIDQLAVMDLMAIGEFALLPEDDLTLAVVLKSPLIGLTEDELFELAYSRKGTLWQALRSKRTVTARFGAAHDLLIEILARVETHPPYEFFARVLSSPAMDTGSGRERFLSRLGQEAADPIDEFLGLTLDYERVEAPTLQGFLSWVRADASDIKREFDHAAEEVRVITVHGSKGLQAPIVFLPDTCSMPSARSDAELISLGDDTNPLLLWRQGKGDEDERTAQVRQRLKIEREEEQRRLLYVAMTRARDRLYIAGYETSRTRPDGCWYNLVESALKPQMTAHDVEDGQVWRLQLPKMEGPGKDSKKEHAAQQAKPLPLPAWIGNPVTTPETPKQVLAPSKLPGDEENLQDEIPLSPLAEGGVERFRRGSLIHTLLQYLPNLAPENREVGAEKYLISSAQDLSGDERREIVAEVLAVLTLPEFAAIFGAGSIAEAPLTGRLSGTDLELNGQVDRLLVTDDRVLVIDYKTNRPPPTEIQDVAPLYIRQMAAYRALLQEICPGREVSCALLWTDGPRLMALPGDLLDKEIARIREAAQRGL